MYSLSSQLEGHTADVRALSHTSDGQIVSTSRDVTCRLWQRLDTSPRDYETNKTLQGHSRYIIAVCALPKEFAEAIGTFARTDLIATGSNDHLINLYALDTDETLLNPIAAFKGHTNAVCCLNYHRGALLSSSWDGTCRVWKGVNSFVELKGHTSTVWCVVGVPDTDYLLSASGDRSLRLWDMQGVARLKYEGHQDAVRSILPIDQNSFLSASNDSVIIQWNLHSGDRMKSFLGHESLIYQLYPLPGNEGFVSVGEDKSFRIWNYENTSPIETMRHPAMSVWAVTVLPNGDIATGSSDGVVRVFSRDPERKAPADILEMYQELCQSSATMDKIDPNELPGLQALATPGKFDHENKLVNNQGSAEVYQWYEKEGEWKKMGEAMGSSIGGTGPATEHAPTIGGSNKMVLDGEEFDQVIDVDVREDQNPLKLGFNYNDDPWMTAQKFMWKHGLSQLFLDQIAQFIAENQKLSGVSTDVSAFSDPYSGANRYIPGTSTTPSNPAPPQTQGDPLSGAGRYIPGAAAPQPQQKVETYISIPPDPPITRFSGYAPTPLSTPPPDSTPLRHIPTSLPAHYTRKSRITPTNSLRPPPPSPADNKFYPKRDFQLFPAKDPVKMMDKLREFNTDGILSAQDLADANSILTDRDFEPWKLRVLIKLLSWPPQKAFIALDTIRIALLDLSGNKFYAEEEGEGLLHFSLYSLPAAGEITCSFLWIGVNIVNNLFAHRPGQYLMEHTFDLVIPRLIQLIYEHSAAKVQIGVSTICLNYCFMATAVKNEQLYSLCGGLVRELLSTANNPETQFRALVAFGHLAALAPEGIMDLITNANVFVVVQSLAAYEEVSKVSECAKLLQTLLRSKQK